MGNDTNEGQIWNYSMTAFFNYSGIRNAELVGMLRQS